VLCITTIRKMSTSDRESVSSMASNMSERSVSVFGEEMPLDEAIDQIFKEIQSHINDMHCSIRELCQSEDRNDSYEEAIEFFDSIASHVKEGNTVFKELVKVCKQLLPKKPKDYVEKKAPIAPLGTVQEE
jgi:hypothetical protein